uniref:Uncharacterized protein n=1 Tax=Anguilla anguilla TaxID=7936 RepID=A0A0E9SDV7_ANGAN
MLRSGLWGLSVFTFLHAVELSNLITNTSFSHFRCRFQRYLQGS